MAGGYENEDRLAELEEMRREKEREALERLRRQQQDDPQFSRPEFAVAKPMPAPTPTAKDDRLEMLKELAKLTKPTGNSAKGKAIEGSEEE